jgi:4-amino-4-deoxy-L-arabinose transferase-like glycosyltransferase
MNAPRNFRDGWIAAGATAVLLLPFLGKAYNIDDPLFLWVARRIQVHPLDPFGFDVIWYFNPMPMWSVTKNPPLLSYLVAGWAAVAGWSEAAIHLLTLALAVLAVLGTRRLALDLGAESRVAVWATLASPVFLVSATTVMSDVPMLAAFVWALALWVEGIERNDRRRLLASAVLAGLAALTKYFAISLVPLFVLYALLRRARPGRFLPPLAATIVLLAAYQAATASLYGRGLLLDAVSYANTARDTSTELSRRVPAGIVFVGGAVLLAPVFVAMCLRGRRLLAAAAAVAAVALLLPLDPALGGGPAGWGGVLAWRLFAAAACATLALVVDDLLAAPRDAAGWSLAAWVLGTIAFAAVVNWTVNGRSVLPLVPAVAIAVGRTAARCRLGPRAWAGPVAASVLVALAVAWGDAAEAGAVRRAARELMAEPAPGATWFQGHWGFHYYMQELGARPADIDGALPNPGDRVVAPVNNTNTFDMPEQYFERIGTVRFTVAAPAATIDPVRGVSFYAAVRGPLPYLLGSPAPDEYVVYRARPR